MSDLPPTPPRLPGAPPRVPPSSHTGLEPPPLPPPPRMSGAFVVLMLLLAVSLAASAVLAVRLADAEATSAAERAKTEVLRGEVERLRGVASTAATTSPGPVGQGQIGRISAAVARLRGLAFKKAVVPEVVSAAELRKRVEEDFLKEQNRTQIESTDRVLTTLGLLKPGDDLYRILQAVQTEQIAGYYDSDAKRLVVTGNPSNLSPYEQVLMAHELVHALTDQHFGLSRLDRLQDEGKDDEATAYLALVEGDATLMMFLYRDRVLTQEEQRQMQQEAETQESPQLDAAPQVVRESLIFPYDRGALFANSLYQSGGTKAIDDAYRNPPTSTEQILHPQKFLSRDIPEDVTMPDVRAAMGSGWTTLEDGPAGEFDVELIADEFLPNADARSAASGWDGGAYIALAQGARTLVAASTVWDSAEDAREAAAQLTEWLRPRFGGQGSSYRTPAGSGWESSDGAGEVARSGTSVVLILGPDRASVERARRAFPAFAA